MASVFPIAPIQWPSGGWIKANRNQANFYRMNYDAGNWLEITNYLKTIDLESSVTTVTFLIYGYQAAGLVTCTVITEKYATSYLYCFLPKLSSLPTKMEIRVVVYNY